MGNGLAVHEVLLQPHVAPHGLHHAQAHRVVVVADADRRELVRHSAVERLQPRDQRLVALELRDHALAVGRGLERPVHAALDDLVAGHVDDAHRSGRVGGGGE